VVDQKSRLDARKAYLQRATNVFVTTVFLFTIASLPIQAQTFSVIHTFTGGSDGMNPLGGGLTVDAAGNLYGTASAGGMYSSNCNAGGSCGTVFKVAHAGSGWVFHILYSFNGNADGHQPDSRVVLGPDGALYGTTFFGLGNGCGGDGCGTVFKLAPPLTACRSALCPWNENRALSLYERH
jgi:hypothetical protein